MSLRISPISYNAPRSITFGEGEKQAQENVAVEEEPKKGMSKSTKVITGIGALALIGAGIWYAMRGKGSAATKAAEEAAEAAGKLGDDVAGAVGKAGEAVSEAAEAAGAKVGEAVAEGAEAAGAKVGEAVAEGAEAAGVKVGEAVAEGAEAAGVKTGEAVAEGAEAAGAKTGEVATEGAEAAGAKAGDEVVDEAMAKSSKKAVSLMDECREITTDIPSTSYQFRKLSRIYGRALHDAKLKMDLSTEEVKTVDKFVQNFCNKVKQAMDGKDAKAVEILKSFEEKPLMTNQSAAKYLFVKAYANYGKSKADFLAKLDSVLAAI